MSERERAKSKIGKKIPHEYKIKYAYVRRLKSIVDV